MRNKCVKKYGKRVIIVLLLVFAMIIRLPSISHNESLLFLNRGLIYALIYFGLFIVWGVSIKKRIIQKQVQSFLMFIVSLIIFWFLVRTIKYIFVEGYDHIARIMWYSYYIPMLLIPMISVFIALSLGKTEEYRLPKWGWFIYLPAIILICIVLSNDYHQLVFIFPKSIDMGKSEYRYGIIYWVVYFWMVLSILVALVITIRKSRVPHSKSRLYLPFIPYVVGLIYGILYILNIPLLRVVAGDMTAIFCLFTIAIYECLIQSGLIRSNMNYEELFYFSDLDMRIIDNDGIICYESKPFVRKDDVNTRASTYPISGGQVLWQEDVSEINGLIKELEKINQSLSEENSLMQAELELKERRIKIDEKIRLNNEITKKVEPQLLILEDILSDTGQSIDEKYNKLTQLCVLGTYIKRQSNLIILNEDKKVLSARELEFSMRESVEAISQSGRAASIKADCQGYIKAKTVILIYGLFQEILEATLFCLSALFVNLSIKDGQIKVLLQISGCEGNRKPGVLVTNGLKYSNMLVEERGEIEVVEEDGDAIAVSIRIPKGA
ncbi:MAG: histidine kinase N-terminal 7TM domain-containing protein [Anaerovoracaceae bacterium]|jgi:hypothetical protein